MTIHVAGTEHQSGGEMPPQTDRVTGLRYSTCNLFRFRSTLPIRGTPFHRQGRMSTIRKNRKKWEWCWGVRSKPGSPLDHTVAGRRGMAGNRGWDACARWAGRGEGAPIGAPSGLASPRIVSGELGLQAAAFHRRFGIVSAPRVDVATLAQQGCVNRVGGVGGAAPWYGGRRSVLNRAQDRGFVGGQMTGRQARRIGSGARRMHDRFGPLQGAGVLPIPAARGVRAAEVQCRGQRFEGLFDRLQFLRLDLRR